MHAQNLAIIKGLVAVAWADGKVCAEEQQVIDALLEAYRATPSEAREVRLFANSPRGLDDIILTDLSYDDRRYLLHQSVLLTFADGQQEEAELALLDELGRRLRIPASEADQIMSAASEQAKGLVGLL
ncbi:MAG: TerB family tellurite resistance protein [Polyangiaceae bacterium]|nr:TerB family tellurite resistance protein [Polyangiaceae bacterium]